MFLLHLYDSSTQLGTDLLIPKCLVLHTCRCGCWSRQISDIVIQDSPSFAELESGVEVGWSVWEEKVGKLEMLGGTVARDGGDFGVEFYGNTRQRGRVGYGGLYAKNFGDAKACKDSMLSFERRQLLKSGE